MAHLIDGYNLLGALGGLGDDTPEALFRLLVLLRSWVSRERRRGVVVVLDGGRPAGPAPELSAGGVSVVFAPPGSSADDLILGRVRRSRNPRQITVVTSDRALRDAVERAGARTLRSEEMARALRRPAPTIPEKPGPPSPEEVEDWLQAFGGDDEPG